MTVIYSILYGPTSHVKSNICMCCLSSFAENQWAFAGYPYEMTSKYTWHYVKPLNGEPVYSIMGSGLPWKNIGLSESRSASHTSLNSHI